MVEEQGKSGSDLWSRSQTLEKEVENKFLLAAILLPSGSHRYLLPAEYN